jgi:mannonate dehydratase
MSGTLKLGFGLYRHQLDDEHFDFARQCGATHLVVHLCDYFARSEPAGAGHDSANQPVGDRGGWGRAQGAADPIWTLEGLEALRKQVESHDLKIWAVENFDPAMWSDILLDGPRKDAQMEGLQRLIRDVGRAGIPVFGYNFSLAGVCSRELGPVARGNARSVYMRGVDETPVPAGMVWNMVYDPDAGAGEVENVPHEELWRRLQWYLERLVPVAEEAGVRLAAHPDDPPMPVVRQTPRLVYQPDMYHRLLDAVPSRSNALEFCLGTIAEMTEGDVYEAVDTFCRRDAIAYLHFRNVRGKVPEYQETFIDEGDVNMLQVLRILEANGYDGVLVPDHTPLMSCAAPWHAGMAYAMGYMKSALQQL